VRYEDAAGRFSRPCSLADCLRLAAEDPEAEFVAGNTDLGVATNLRGQRFVHLISLEGIPDLREFRNDATGVEIGAALTLTEIGEQWNDAPGIFREWLPLFASLPLRNRATLGGNLATASPIGDSAPMLLALGAEVRITGRSGERIVPLHEFFRDYRQTALERNEIVRSVRIPKPWPTAAHFFKVAKRSLDDISTVAAGIAVSRGEDGRIRETRIAFGGVAATPVRSFTAEQALAGTYGEERDLERAKDALRRTLRPIGDHRGSAGYRLAMAQSLLDKFLWETQERVPA
jgi:xanthine dehydrogenase small subunit